MLTLFIYLFAHSSCKKVSELLSL